MIRAVPVDAQLPPALARFLDEQGHFAEHVFDLCFNEAEDSVIWDYALRHSAVIVTKDEDFSIRTALQRTGPAIVWLRAGNTSNRALPAWFAPLLPESELALPG